MVFHDGGRTVHIPTLARQVLDVTSAGDTAAAVLARGMAAGLPVVDATVPANIAAGIEVGEPGSAAVSAVRLKEAR